MGTFKNLPNCFPQRAPCWSPAAASGCWPRVPLDGVFLPLVTGAVPSVGGISLGTDWFDTHRSSSKCLVQLFCPIFYTGFLLVV